jgi:hypothetical protein
METRFSIIFRFEPNEDGGANRDASSARENDGHPECEKKRINKQTFSYTCTFDDRIKRVNIIGPRARVKVLRPMSTGKKTRELSWWGDVVIARCVPAARYCLRPQNASSIRTGVVKNNFKKSI